MFWKILGIFISCDEEEQAQERYRQLYNSGKEIVETPTPKGITYTVADRPESALNKALWFLPALLLGETKEE